jgi:tetratricopeptide (TPR) repeat protein
VDRLIEEARRIRHQDTRRALGFCREAEALALRLDHQPGYAHALLLGGLCLVILGGERERALGTLERALALLETLGDLAGQGEALNLMATLQADQEDLPAAIALHQRALQMRRLAKDRIGESGSLLNLGLVYRDQSQFAEGLQQFFTSLEIAEELGHIQTQAYAKQSIGDTLALLGDTEQAMV